ncbi:MAG: hypothetical protein Q4C46_08685 [Bacillota bacterium]|nr:hypothetical protein [Bacillota bacterium]
METIKQSRRRLAISLLTIIAMVFTLIPCMGVDVAEADTNGLVQTYTPTESCPVSKVEYTPRDDGKFNIKVTLDLNMYKTYDQNKTYYYDMSIYNDSYTRCITGEQSSLGKAINGQVAFSYGDDSHYVQSNEQFNVKFELYDENVQDPNARPINNPGKLNCTAPTYPSSTTFYNNVQTKDCYSSDKNSAVIQQTFTADSSKVFTASASYVESSGYAYDTSFELQVKDSDNNIISAKLINSSDFKAYEWNFTKSDTYTFALICKYASSGKCAYTVSANLKQVPKTPDESFGWFRAVPYGDSQFKINIENYEGSYGSDNNVYYREDMTAGTITCIENSISTEVLDTVPYYDRKYTYYVAKKGAIEAAVPGLTLTLMNPVSFKDSTTKAKLKSVSAYAEVTASAPTIVKVNNLKATAGVRSASLTWKYEYDTTAPNVTGFNVNIYAPNGSLYKTYKYTPQYSSYCGATYSIPYDGTYYFTVTPYYVYNGKTYTGTASAKVGCASSKISAATGSVTKISSKKARITIKKSAGSTGTMVYQYVSGKWKYIGKTTGSSYTVTKNTAGKKKYRLRSYIVDNGKTYYSGSYSGTYSPKSNTAAFKYSNRPAAYPMYSHYWRPDKIYYSGNKVVVKGKFINTHIYRLDYFKIKLTVKCQGKVIGTKTINSGKMKSNKVKKVTVKLDKSKAGYDLRAGNLTWSYKIIKWR